MRRFNVYVRDYSCDGCYEFEERDHPTGQYVDADEAVAEIEKLRAENEALRAKLAERESELYCARIIAREVCNDWIGARLRASASVWKAADSATGNSTGYGIEGLAIFALSGAPEQEPKS